MTLNQIYFNFIDNQRSLLSLFKYDFSDLQINEEENSENNMMLNQGNLGNNFLEINPFSQMEEEVFSSSLPTGDNIMKIDSSIDTDNKTKILFEVNTLIPDPFLEYQINVIIRLMDINKEQKEKYYLETKEICDKIYLVRDKIMLKKNERRRHLKRKNGVFENKNKDESNETIKTGRKKKSDGTNRFHNKYSLDNLFNKAKNMINKSLIEFINILINKIYTKEKIIF